MKKQHLFSTILLSCITLSIQAQQVNINPSAMMAFWNFNESSETSIMDASSYEHDLVFTSGVSFVEGKHENALDIPYGEWASIMDPVLDSKFPCSSMGAPVEAMSTMAWVKLGAISGRQPILVKEAENERGFVFSVTEGLLDFQVHNLNEEKLIVMCDSVSLALDTWYHVAATYEYSADWSSTVKLYLNGKLIHVDNAVPGPIKACNADLVVGAYLYNDAGMYNDYGTLTVDEVCVFSAVLTQEEIADMMINGVTVGTGPKYEISHSFNIYPNPVNSLANIRITLRDDSHVELSVYDVNGRLIKSLINQEMSQGEHTILLDAENMEAGIYISRLKIGDRSFQKRIVLSR